MFSIQQHYWISILNSFLGGQNIGGHGLWLSKNAPSQIIIILLFQKTMMHWYVTIVPYTNVYFLHHKKKSIYGTRYRYVMSHIPQFVYNYVKNLQTHKSSKSYFKSMEKSVFSAGNTWNFNLSTKKLLKNLHFVGSWSRFFCTMQMRLCTVNMDPLMHPIFFLVWN